MPNSIIHHTHKRKLCNEKMEPYPHPEKLKHIMDRLIYFICAAMPLIVIPQVWKIWSEKNAGGISLITYAGLMIANVIWVIYGVLHKERPIIFLYVSFFIINSLITLGAILYG